jgi:hypothetical protein
MLEISNEEMVATNRFQEVSTEVKEALLSKDRQKCSRYNSSYSKEDIPAILQGAREALSTLVDENRPADFNEALRALRSMAGHTDFGVTHDYNPLWDEYTKKLSEVAEQVLHEKKSTIFQHSEVADVKGCGFPRSHQTLFVLFKDQEKDDVTLEFTARPDHGCQALWDTWEDTKSSSLTELFDSARLAFGGTQDTLHRVGVNLMQEIAKAAENPCYARKNAVAQLQGLAPNL